MNGFINFFKPSGVSSAYAINGIKKLFKGCKIGHMGTLDPLAEGVLPIAVGKATRLFDFLLDKQKEYVAEFTFGYQTDTLDRGGNVVFEGGKIPSKEEILAVFKNKDTYILMLPNFIRGIATGIVGVIAVLAMSGGIIVESQASIVTIVLQAGLLVGNLLFVLTCKRFKTRTAMFISNTIFCVLLPFAFTFGTIGFIIVLVISLIFRCLVDTAIPVLVTEIIPKDEIGPFTSIRMLVFTAGQAVAPMLITPISNSVGGVGVLVVAAVLQFLCGLVYFIVAKTKKKCLGLLR